MTASLFSAAVVATLRRSGVVFKYVHGAMSQSAVRVQGKWPVKGAWERNIALDYLTESVNGADASGVVYFADDDNTYDSRLFDEVLHRLSSESDDVTQSLFFNT